MATSYQIGFMEDGKIRSQIVVKTKSCKYKNFDYILSIHCHFDEKSCFFEGLFHEEKRVEKIQFLNKKFRQI